MSYSSIEKRCYELEVTMCKQGRQLLEIVIALNDLKIAFNKLAGDSSAIQASYPPLKVEQRGRCRIIQFQAK